MRDLLVETARRIAPLGWHVQLYAELAMVADLAETLRGLPVPTVLDHMGGARAGDPSPALHPVLDLLSDGTCWVKLSGADRVSRRDSGFGGAVAVAKRLIDANPERVVWGTDWPHTAGHAGRPRPDAPPIDFRSVDDAALLDGLAEACGDAPTFAEVLAANPARLYGF